MMTFGRTDFGITAIAAFVGVHKGQDPRRIALDRERDHVHHQLAMRIPLRGTPAGRG